VTLKHQTSNNQMKKGTQLNAMLVKMADLRHNTDIRRLKDVYDNDNQ